jgi:hypothetical protein
MGWPTPPGEQHNHVGTERLERPLECTTCKKTLEFCDLLDKKPSFLRRLFGATAELVKACPYCGASVDTLLSRER